MTHVKDSCLSVFSQGLATGHQDTDTWCGDFVQSVHARLLYHHAATSCNYNTDNQDLRKRWKGYLCLLCLTVFLLSPLLHMCALLKLTENNL